MTEGGRRPEKEAELGDDETNGLGTPGEDDAASQPEKETLEGIAPPPDDAPTLGGTGWLGASRPIGMPPPPPPPPLQPRRGRLPLALAGLIVIAGALAAASIALGGGSTSKSGNAAPSSPSAAPSPSLLDPTGLRASAKPFLVTLSWTQPAGGTSVETYVVYRNHSLLDEIPATITTYHDDSVDPGKKYTYELEAKAGDLQTRFLRVKVSTPTPRLGDARLEGDFNVKFTFESSSGFQSTTNSFTAGWHFKPKCKTGGCDVTWTDLTEKSLKAALDRKRDKYTGSDSGTFFATCGSHKVTSSLTIDFKVTKAKGMSGEWRATKFEGTVLHSASSQLGCVSSSATLKITGSLLS
jgi:hypothetical protein